MNNIFSIQRCSKLLSKYTRENLKTNLMAIAVLTGIMFIAFGLSAYSNHGYISIKVQAVFFTIFLLFSGGIFTSMIFSDLGNKTKAIPILTIPVSHFERLLVGWLYSFVIFQLLFIACFYAVDLIVLNIGSSVAGAKNEIMHLSSKDAKVYLTFPIYTMVHAFAFLGALYFDKLHFIKSSFAVFVFGIFLLLINQPLVYLLFGQVKASTSPPFIGVMIKFGDDIRLIESDGPANMVIYIMTLALVLLLWTAAYFKLKEKQV